MSQTPSNTSSPSAQEIIERVEREKVVFIDLQFTDIVGIVKNITIPAQELPSAIDHGAWFDGSSIEGFARIAESDMYLVPDLATFALIPWLPEEEKTARLICNVYTPSGHPFIGDPRGVLSRVLAEADKMGLVYNTGPELEFFLLKSNGSGDYMLPLTPHDSAGYFDAPEDSAAGLRRKMVSTLAVFGITVEALHHEVANGQHEIDFRYSDALRTADNAVTFRLALKNIAQRHGMYATFLPKPMRGVSGNGMHVHQSLMYKNGGVNAFADSGDTHGLSTLAKQFIAGQLAHARGMCAILAPLVNSYKRLVAGYEAPVYISWGRINRSALIRVPRAHAEESTRLELRCPDPSCNPYLAFAVMLAAGLDGIKRGLTPPEATDENLYLRKNQNERQHDLLPRTLDEALEALEKDQVVRDALGQHVFERFMNAKRAEWEDYLLEVTNWELRTYLSVF